MFALLSREDLPIYIHMYPFLRLSYKIEPHRGNRHTPLKGIIIPYLSLPAVISMLTYLLAMGSKGS